MQTFPSLSLSQETPAVAHAAFLPIYGIRRDLVHDVGIAAELSALCRNVGTCSEFVNLSRSAFVRGISCEMISNANTLRIWKCEGSFNSDKECPGVCCVTQPGHPHRRPYIPPTFRTLTHKQAALFLFLYTWGGDRNASKLLQLSADVLFHRRLGCSGAFRIS